MPGHNECQRRAVTLAGSVLPTVGIGIERHFLLVGILAVVDSVVNEAIGGVGGSDVEVVLILKIITFLRNQNSRILHSVVKQYSHRAGSRGSNRFPYISGAGIFITLRKLDIECYLGGGTHKLHISYGCFFAGGVNIVGHSGIAAHHKRLLDLLRVELRRHTKLFHSCYRGSLAKCGDLFIRKVGESVDAAGRAGGLRTAKEKSHLLVGYDYLTLHLACSTEILEEVEFNGILTVGSSRRIKRHRKIGYEVFVKTCIR